MLQFPERLPDRTCLRERVLHQAQIGEELRATAVGQVRVPQPGRLQPLRQVEQVRAVRLLGGPGLQVGEQLRVRRLRGLQGQGEIRARRRRVSVHGERAADPGGGVLQGAERVIGLDDRGFPGDLRGHERVAIPVRANPAAEAQERGDRGRGRSGVRFRLAPPGLIKRAVQDGRHQEERFVERGHHSAHLVDRPHGPVPQRRGQPQQVDLLTQLAPDLRLLGRILAGMVKRREQDADPAQCGDHGAASRLGGMGGEHGMHTQPGEQFVKMLRALLLAELADR